MYAPCIKNYASLESSVQKLNCKSRRDQLINSLFLWWYAGCCSQVIGQLIVPENWLKGLFWPISRDRVLCNDLSCRVR